MNPGKTVNLRSILAPALAAALVVAGCGGGSDDAGSELVPAGPAPAGPAAQAALDEATAVIEATGYSCTANDFVLSPSVSVSCLTTSSILVAAYAWEDADVASQYGVNDYSCTEDSELGEVLTLVGSTWAIKAAVAMTPTVENVDAITATLTSFQEGLGGEIVSTPCA